MRDRVSLADARAKARSVLVSVDNGDDPAVAKALARRAETFGDLWDEYFTRHAKQNKRSWRDDERIAKAELLPHWRHRKAKDVTRARRSARPRRDRRSEGADHGEPNAGARAEDLQLRTGARPGRVQSVPQGQAAVSRAFARSSADRRRGSVAVEGT